MGADMQIINWLVGLLLLSVTAIKLLWGGDLIVAAHMTQRRRWWHIFRDGSIYLGWYFVMSAIFIYGALGFVLLSSPAETVPAWFAGPCLIFTIDCILAWHFLGPERSPSEGDSYDPA